MRDRKMQDQWCQVWGTKNAVLENAGLKMQNLQNTGRGIQMMSSTSMQALQALVLDHSILSELCFSCCYKETSNTTVSWMMRLNHCRNCVFSCFKKYLEYLCIVYESWLTLFHTLTSSFKLLFSLRHCSNITLPNTT